MKDKVEQIYQEIEQQQRKTEIENREKMRKLEEQSRRSINGPTEFPERKNIKKIIKKIRQFPRTKGHECPGSTHIPNASAMNNKQQNPHTKARHHKISEHEGFGEWGAGGMKINKQ